MNEQSFTHGVTRNIAKIPRIALAAILGTAIVLALVDVGCWSENWKPGLAELPLIIPYAAAVSAVEYLAVVSIIGVKPTISSYGRFVITALLVISPLIVSVGLLFTAPVIGRGLALTAFFVLAAAGFLIAAWLPAWPAAQSISATLINPVRIFKATRGHRWGLIGMALVLSAINRQKLIPDVDKAGDLAHAFAYAAGEAGTNAISMIYTAAVAATAYAFTCRNDEDLYPARP